MLRRSFSLRAVRVKGDVFWRNSLDSVRAKVAESTPLLQERPYPIAEITKRMVRLRIKYEESEDEKEMQLLRGEYKFYTGKAIHLRECSTTDLVALVSCSAFFGFWDTALLDRILEQITGRIHELSTMELSQLAQDLPLIERSRSPQMRMVFKLLCANNCERLREDLSFEDHFDLIERAVGTHCPFVFVRTLLELIEPYIPGYAAFLDEQQQQQQSKNNNNDNIHDNDNNNSTTTTGGGIKFKSEGLLSILQTLRLADSMIEKTSKHSVSSQSYRQFQFMKTSLVRRLKQQLLSNARDQVSGNFNSNNINNNNNIHSPSGASSPIGSNAHPSMNSKGKLIHHNSDEAAMFPLMPPSVMAKTFHLLATIEVLDEKKKSSSSGGGGGSEKDGGNEHHNLEFASALDHFTAKQVLEFFWTSQVLRKLSCSETLDLCLGYMDWFGITEFFEAEFFLQVAQDYLIENVSFLDVRDLSSAFELIARFATQGIQQQQQKERGSLSSSSSSVTTYESLTQKRNLVTSEFFDGALDQLILLRAAGAGNATIWPTNAVLDQLKSLTVIVDCMRKDQSTSTSTNNTNNNHHKKNEFNLQRPQLHAGVKTLCACLIANVQSAMSPQDCSAFLGVAATMDTFVLDSCVGAVIKRLVKNWVIAFEVKMTNGDDSTTTIATNNAAVNAAIEKDGGLCYLESLSLQEIEDLLVLWTSVIMNTTTNNNSSETISETNKKRKVHPLVEEMLLPALKSAQKYKMKEELM